MLVYTCLQSLQGREGEEYATSKDVRIGDYRPAGGRYFHQEQYSISLERKKESNTNCKETNYHDFEFNSLEHDKSFLLGDHFGAPIWPPKINKNVWGSLFL